MPSVSFPHLSKMAPVLPPDLSLPVRGAHSGLGVVWLHSQWEMWEIRSGSSSEQPILSAHTVTSAC